MFASQLDRTSLSCCIGKISHFATWMHEENRTAAWNRRRFRAKIRSTPLLPPLEQIALSIIQHGATEWLYIRYIRAFGLRGKSRQSRFCIFHRPHGIISSKDISKAWTAVFFDETGPHIYKTRTEWLILPYNVQLL